ncbi:HD-GYP domain-containing protein [Actinomadura viridis]|uniref:HD superfamily phosphohydrolase YqeK/xanthosine utilization system XapX-like protein n=3 Tax=Actinomadura viridis TaxID=58110 RepID=A0A931GLH7_9ACTN|nr:HD-GYP domain-containing protein [Actinomadura viridis]MBG6087471.1 HD superfamily phosphohydrolase YqeK/xanthosine utilization system XapX-like protein [Actinomadura viridis]
MRGLPPVAWAYVCGVVALAAGLIATASYEGLDWRALAVLAVLFLICDSAPALLNVERARVSLSFAASLASVVLLGPAGAALLGVCAIVTGQRLFAPVKRLFNGAQFALCGYTSGMVFGALGGRRFEPGQAGWVEHVIGPFLGALVTFVLVNLLLVAGILLLSRQAVPRELLSASGQLAFGCLGYGMFGLLIAGLWSREGVGPFAAVLVLLPLFIARWALEQTRAQQQAHAATLAALCQAVETKDYYTRGHSERVSRGSVMIAREIGMRADRVEAIRYAGMLHDVGKLGVPTKVLQKAGSLTEEEFAAIQLHPMRGLEIVREIGFLDEALAGIMHHHERMNGRGYPMGLAGDEIPEFARVISVADAFDSMTSTRSYRPARTVEEAVEELRRGVGDHFDPGMVEAFLRALERDGWEPPKPVVLPDDDIVETTQQDHDDPSTPIRVAGEDDRTGDADGDADADAAGGGDAAGGSGAARDTARR